MLWFLQNKNIWEIKAGSCFLSPERKEHQLALEANEPELALYWTKVSWVSTHWSDRDCAITINLKPLQHCVAVTWVDCG